MNLCAALLALDEAEMDLEDSRKKLERAQLNLEEARRFVRAARLVEDEKLPHCVLVFNGGRREEVVIAQRADTTIHVRIPGEVELHEFESDESGFWSNNHSSIFGYSYLAHLEGVPDAR